MIKRKPGVDAVKRQRVICNAMAFDITSHEKFTVAVAALDSSGESFSISFTPSIGKCLAMQTVVSVTHLPSRLCNCRLLVLPHTARVQRRLIGTRLRYLAFETHAIQLDPEANTRICTMWLQLDDVQVSNPDAPPIYQPSINWTWFFQEVFPGRYTGLPYLPPDPSIEVSQLAALGINPAWVPQRCPLWFKLRAELTGSLICKLLGEFVPKPGTPAAMGFAADKFEPFTGWKRIDVQLGRLREPVQIACVLAAFPLREFRETGSILHPGHVSWSASPDGFVLDREITPELVAQARAPGPHKRIIPLETLQDFPEVDPLPGGVIEFKASRTNFAMSGYHIEQCVWEMFCTNTLWCDLVRYTEQWERDAQGAFKPATRCKIIRLFRCKRMEERVTELVQRSNAVKRDAAKFMALVHTDPYVDIRRDFNDLANKCNAAAMEIPVPVAIIERMAKHRDHLATQSVALDLPSLHPALDRIEERQSKAFALYNGNDGERAEFVTVAAEQIEDYAVLIKSVLEK